MTIINLPSGTSVDFEDASKEQIEESLLLLQENSPELFEGPQISEEDYIKSLTAEEAIAYGRRRYGGREAESQSDEVSDIAPAGS